jgi:DNA-binding IclR family transcriptional regulator
MHKLARGKTSSPFDLTDLLVQFDERILVARVDGKASLRYDLPLGKRLPLTLGAADKILLACAPRANFSKWLPP